MSERIPSGASRADATFFETDDHARYSRPVAGREFVSGSLDAMKLYG